MLAAPSADLEATAFSYSLAAARRISALGSFSTLLALWVKVSPAREQARLQHTERGANTLGEALMVDKKGQSHPGVTA